MGHNIVCGGRGILFFADNRYIKFRVTLWEGSNDYVKLMALKLVLLLMNEKGINSLQALIPRLSSNG